ncbi:MAG: Z1 domain-containing protein [Thermoplasmata archaeon]
MDEIHNQILGMSHSYFSGREVTPDTIRGFIARMVRAYPESKLDGAWLFGKLESLHTVFIGPASTLDDAAGHEEWFNPSTNSPLKRDFRWHFWDHYREYIIKAKGWPPRVAESIDSLSSEILSRLEDPTRIGDWDRRGMVMGSVQSGKTANYTALITKAADAGYKLFIVLAGVHNSLRSQTQSRLNEEFLGYDIDKVQKLTGAEKRIGVRKRFHDHRTVWTLTSSSEKGDFKKAVATQSGIFPDPDGPSIILVVKKNVTILNNLINWVPSVIGREDEKGRDVIPHIPVLVIDDECDYASVNTKRPELDEDGRPINEWNPTKINALIRQLLTIFRKCCYVGYTATPYANIFIHKDHVHERYGEDLFPRSFIISLPQPSNYTGPDRVFGLDADPDREMEATEPLPLIRAVEDFEDIIPNKHRKDLVVDALPPSLEHAVKSFLLTCAARHLRQEGTPHNSMLIHVTRFTLVQAQVSELVENFLRRLVARIMSGDHLDDFRRIWEEDYLPTSRRMRVLGFRDSVVHSWEEILPHLHTAARVVRVKLINGTAKDYLDYRDVEVHTNSRRMAGEDVPWEEMGANVIAIGGDKLSRGLTLEGLTISYYLRASRMYDTLMQMGRWFGYRDGYSDLCRIYTSEELVTWYRHIARATGELREDVNYMSVLGKTPLDFGLKVRSHPGRLIVTNAGKSRHGEMVSLSYDGHLSETVVFDPRETAKNREALVNMVRRIGREPDHAVGEVKPRLRWSGVTPDIVLNFLREYRTQEEARRIVNPDWIAGYIERQNKHGELVAWDVAIVSKRKPHHTIEIEGHTVGCLLRNALDITDEKISIRRLVSPADELIDLSPEEEDLARQFTRLERERALRQDEPPSGKAIRHIRPPTRGLMLIYVTYGGHKSGREYGTHGDGVVGFAVSFPFSENAEPVEYLVNPVYMEEEVHYA